VARQKLASFLEQVEKHRDNMSEDEARLEQDIHIISIGDIRSEIWNFWWEI